MHTFKIHSIFPHMHIEIPQINDDITRTFQVPFTRYFIVKTLSLCVWCLSVRLISTYCLYHFSILPQFSSLCGFFFQLPQRFQVFLLLPRFQPLIILRPFLTTTVHTSVMRQFTVRNLKSKFKKSENQSRQLKKN